MSRKFDIVTDSSCDMSEEYLTLNAVDCVRLGVEMDGKSYLGENGLPLDSKFFYDTLRGGAMPTTCQVTSEQAMLHIEKHLASGRDVLVVAFSSGLSGTCGSFQVASRELSLKYPSQKIVVVDTLCASMGEGLILDYAIKWADGGKTLEETANYLESIKLNICHQFTVDDLFHLKRGGRVSGAVAVIGSVVKIKPVMHVDNEGKLVKVGIAMGRKKSLLTIMQTMLKTHTMEENDPIFISHGDCLDEVEWLCERIREKLGDKRIVVNNIGPVIGSHAGAGTVALFYLGSER